MRKISFQVVTIFLAIIFAQATHAASETILQYISACKTQLGFTGASIPVLKCDNNASLFAPSSTGTDPTNDFVGYYSVNDAVDLVFACRWLRTDANDQNIRKAFSIEMLINNRQTGNTCFFSGKGYADKKDPNETPLVPATLVSITDQSSTNITNYWDTPDDINSSNRKCVGCHIAGPYIASPRIAPFLAQFGLLNNGHDTLPFTINNGTAVLNQPARYHAVVTPLAAPNVSAFATWDSDARSYINDFNAVTNDPSLTVNDPQYQPDGCSAGCHSFGGSTPQFKDISSFNFTLIPSILSDLVSVINAGVMPPYDDNSDYRWINLDSPGDGVETENFADAKSAHTTLVPNLLGNCTAPGVMEAHAVGTPDNYAFATDKMSLIPDRLRTFNLKEGLVCLNSDQDPGQSCHDYTIRYLCGVSNTDGTPTWSGWYNTDSPSSDGDHEERSRDQNICGGAIPIAIQAQVSVNGNTISVMGPDDRLARFSPYGLTCNNADQPDGQCSNYVVRYSSCSTTPPPPLRTAHLISVYTGKQLTATGTANNALVKGQPLTSGWNTQQWVIEPLQNTEYVRLRNTGTNTYLNVTTQAESATVVTYASNTGYTSEEWIIEPVNNSNDFRLKNLWSGKYLTIADTSTYSAIYSQTLNTGWTSQRWLIQ